MAPLQVNLDEQQLNTNPIQAKIMRAEAFANAVEQKSTCKANGVSSAREVAPSAAGAVGSEKAQISWLSGSKTIIVAFLASSELQALVNNRPSVLDLETVEPFYIHERSWDTNILVSKHVALEFERVHADVKTAVDDLSGHQIRHIVLTGREVGGALACVAAPWAKLCWPQADVRYISFNAPKIGNTDFVDLLGWLAYGYNATEAGQEPSEQPHVSVTTVRYMGKGVELPGFLETGNGEADGGLLEAPPVELATTVRGPKNIVHFLDAENMHRVLFRPRRTRKKLSMDPFTGARRTAEGESEMRAVSKAQLGLTWTNLKWAMHVLNTILAFPFRFFTRSHQKPSKVNIDAVELPENSEKSLEGYLKGLAVAYLLPAALLADAAYSDEQDFRDLTGVQAKLVEVELLHAQCYVAFKDGTALLAFRGSDSIQDWLLDFQIAQFPVKLLQPWLNAPGVEVHLGFLVQLESMLLSHSEESNIKLMLDSLVKQEGGSVDRVVCVGHSLGGALATLGAGWAALQYPEADVRCFTMGSPRVGNDLFVSGIEKLAGTIRRARNDHDIVTFVPPKLGYSHVEPHAVVRGTPDEASWMPLFKWVAPQIIKVCFDHFITGYINALKGDPCKVELGLKEDDSDAGSRVTSTSG
ncbi:hypothetical protein N2152v2_007175 [Parachlorella kessleri]